VRVNRDALLPFWNEGDAFSIDEVVAFVRRLRKS
jgi:hypothetical protein